MKVRQDAWTEEDDLLLAETVLRHVREGSTQLNAFEEVGDKLNRTSAACGFRWNAVVRHNYEKALQLAKKQRKQRQRILGKDQGGKKKLLYSPPQPSIEEIESIAVTPSVEMPVQPEFQEFPSMEVEMSEEMSVPVQTNPVNPTTVAPNSGSIDYVITYLENLKRSNLHLDILKTENERLKRELADARAKNKELEMKIEEMEENTGIMQEDYETLMKIMNRARKLALFEEEDRSNTTFKMDRNGNLEKVAE
ncbi:RsfA family transcriptional regulator [Niallia sp. XMNu-256]|uniref:RsfA family transcriptional regulator n=1 Tax=Niallia sp. XMNu-256 TaxID=3082444 RepID=UPI0030D41E0F